MRGPKILRTGITQTHYQEGALPVSGFAFFGQGLLLCPAAVCLLGSGFRRGRCRCNRCCLSLCCGRRFFANRNHVGYGRIRGTEKLDFVRVRQVADAKNPIHLQSAHVEIDMAGNFLMQTLDFHLAHYLVQNAAKSFSATRKFRMLSPRNSSFSLSSTSSFSFANEACVRARRSRAESRKRWP